MVSVTYDWDAFKHYYNISGCRTGRYQVKNSLEGGLTVKVTAGRGAVILEFPQTEKMTGEERKLYDEILRFCLLHEFMKIEHNVPDEEFFNECLEAPAG